MISLEKLQITPSVKALKLGVVLDNQLLFSSFWTLRVSGYFCPWRPLQGACSVPCYFEFWLVQLTPGLPLHASPPLPPDPPRMQLHERRILEDTYQIYPAFKTYPTLHHVLFHYLSRYKKSMQDSSLYWHPGGGMNYLLAVQTVESLSFFKRRLKTLFFTKHLTEQSIKKNILAYTLFMLLYYLLVVFTLLRQGS